MLYINLENVKLKYPIFLCVVLPSFEFKKNDEIHQLTYMEKLIFPHEAVICFYLKCWMNVLFQKNKTSGRKHFADSSYKASGIASKLSQRLQLEILQNVPKRDYEDKKNPGNLSDYNFNPAVPWFSNTIRR